MTAAGRDRGSRRRRLARRALLAALGVCALAVAAPTAAQQLVAPRIELEFDRPESWALQYFASASLLTGMGPPRDVERGALELGLEVIWVPRLSEEQRRVGFFGNKPEDLNRTPVYARPRLAVGLPGRLVLTASYVPPVEIFDVEPHLLALSLGRPLWQRERWRLGARLSAQTGTLKGDFTCPADVAAAGRDPVRNPFDCRAPSRDRAELRSASLELAGAYRVGDGIEPYLALAAHRHELEFEVGASYGQLVDRTRYLADGWTASAAAGVKLPVGRRLSATVELFYTPLDVVRRRGAPSENDPLFNLRAAVAYRLR